MINLMNFINRFIISHIKYPVFFVFMLSLVALEAILLLFEYIDNPKKRQLFIFYFILLVSFISVLWAVGISSKSIWENMLEIFYLIILFYLFFVLGDYCLEENCVRYFSEENCLKENKIRHIVKLSLNIIWNSCKKYFIKIRNAFFFFCSMLTRILSLSSLILLSLVVAYKYSFCYFLISIILITIPFVRLLWRKFWEDSHCINQIFLLQNRTTEIISLLVVGLLSLYIYLITNNLAKYLSKTYSDTIISRHPQFFAIFLITLFIAFIIYSVFAFYLFVRTSSIVLNEILSFLVPLILFVIEISIFASFVNNTYDGIVFSKSFIKPLDYFNQIFLSVLFSGLIAFLTGSFAISYDKKNNGSIIRYGKLVIRIFSIRHLFFVGVIADIFSVFVLYFSNTICNNLCAAFAISIFLSYAAIFIIGTIPFFYRTLSFIISYRYRIQKIIDILLLEPFDYETTDFWRYFFFEIKKIDGYSMFSRCIKKMFEAFANAFIYINNIKGENYKCRETIVSLTKVLEGFNEILYNNKNSKNADKFARYAYEIIFEKFIKKNTSDKALIQYFIRVFISYLKNGEKDKEIEVYERKSFWEWVYYPDNKSDLSYIEEFKEEFVKFMKKICDFNKENKSEIEGLFNKTIEEYERSEGIPEGIKTAIENVKNEIFGSSRGILYYW